MSFSPQLQTMRVLGFLRLTLCCKAGHIVRLGRALFSWWSVCGCDLWAHQPGGSGHRVAAAFVVPVPPPPLCVWLVEEVQALGGAGASSRLRDGHVGPQAARARETVPQSDFWQGLESGQTLPGIWLLILITVSFQFPRLEAILWKKLYFVLLL